MKELNTVLRYLKRNKSRDPYGYANEILHPDIAGEDLNFAILKLMNRIKSEQTYPEALELCDITSIWKMKGCRNSYDNYRGITRKFHMITPSSRK